MPNPLGGQVHSLDLGEGPRLSDCKGRPRQNDRHSAGHYRTYAGGGGGAEKRTRVSRVGRVHAADCLGHSSRWLEHLFQSAMGGLHRKKATAKAGSFLSTRMTGSARGMPGSARPNTVTPIRLNA